MGGLRNIMAEDTKPIQFEEFAANLSAVFDQVERQEEPIAVERGGRLFVLRPKARRRTRKPRHFSLDDPLFDIIGIGRSTGPTDVSSNKHKYIADAIASHWERQGEAREYSAPATEAPAQPQSEDCSTERALDTPDQPANQA